jgi:AcrR family transcriptional regulator
MRLGSEATRWTILQSAARAFDRHGFAGASISAISREAGLTSGAVYFHFSCKDKLALAVVEEHFASWPALIAKVSRLPATALQRIIILSYEVARSFRDDVMIRAGSRLWTERLAIAVEMPPPFVGWIDTLSAMVREAIADGSADPEVDPETAAAVLVCAFHGTHTVSDALDDRSLIEQRLGHLWHMFLPALRRGVSPSDCLNEALIAAG